MMKNQMCKIGYHVKWLMMSEKADTITFGPTLKNTYEFKC
jgi:hypothetical protein